MISGLNEAWGKFRRKSWWILHLQLGRRFAFQQDDALKHEAKTAQEWLQNNNVIVLEQQRQSPDLSPAEDSWVDVEKSFSLTISMLPDRSNEEWGEKIAVLDQFYYS